MDYETALAFVHGRPRMRKAPTLKRMKAFLERLGQPQAALRGIHVAGTNGKGSTIAYLSAMFQASGHSVGTFTSPFLMRFNERIAVNGQPISDVEITKLVEKIQPIVLEMDQTPLGGPLEFEIVTAMMFLYFQQHPVDIVLVEVGIGGRFDSTNVFTPLVSVITNIGWDHMEILGDSLAKIAYQKAGIIKPKVPLVTGTNDQSALNVLSEVAEQNSASISVLKRDFNYDAPATSFNNGQFEIKHLSNGLLGEYQNQNLAVALQTMLEASTILGWQVDPTKIRRAVQQVEWAGRMEVVQQNPTVILDGAHNLPGIEALKTSIQNYWQGRTVHILAAILDDKRFEAMLATLVEMKQVQVTLTNFKGPTKRNVVNETELGEILKQNINFVDDWRIALNQIKREAASDDIIIITGSLYFISEVRPDLI